MSKSGRLITGNFSGVRNTLLTLFVILIFLPLNGKAQEEQANAEPDSATTFTNLQAALKNPELVYKLDLSKTGLREFPHEVYRFTNLRVLKLNHNRIKKIPASIDSLHNLEELYMSSNRMEEIAPEFGNLSNLRILVISRNNLVIIPQTIGNLKKLEYADMWDNNLNMLPDEVGQIKDNLKTLDLRGILFEEEEHEHIKELLPKTEIFLSPSCRCKN